MGEHLKYEKAAPGALRAMYSLQNYVEECGLEKSLLELVKTRASQINGCAFCIDMHTKDAWANGAIMLLDCLSTNGAARCCLQGWPGEREPICSCQCRCSFFLV